MPFGFSGFSSEAQNDIHHLGYGTSSRELSFSRCSGRAFPGFRKTPCTGTHHLKEVCPYHPHSLGTKWRKQNGHCSLGKVVTTDVVSILRELEAPHPATKNYCNGFSCAKELENQFILVLAEAFCN